MLHFTCPIRVERKIYAITQDNDLDDFDSIRENLIPIKMEFNLCIYIKFTLFKPNTSLNTCILLYFFVIFKISTGY